MSLDLRRCRQVRHALIRHLEHQAPLAVEDALWMAAMTYKLEEQLLIEGLDWFNPGCRATTTTGVIYDIGATGATG